jgi:hypothetical protein
MREPISTQSSVKKRPSSEKSPAFHLTVTVMVWPGVTAPPLGPADVVFTTEPLAAPSKTPRQVSRGRHTSGVPDELLEGSRDVFSPVAVVAAGDPALAGPRGLASAGDAAAAYVPTVGVSARTKATQATTAGWQARLGKERLLIRDACKASWRGETSEVPNEIPAVWLPLQAQRQLAMTVPMHWL